MATFYAARSEIITPLPWLTFALPFSENDVRLLYLKSRYMMENDPRRAAQKAFDQEVLDLNTLNFTNEGPSFREFAKTLLKAGVKIPS